jgi:hypothetical protein
VVINDEAHHCYRRRVGGDEEERLTEELGAVERQIRELWIKALEREYLKSLARYYTQRGPEGDEGGRVEQLEQQRALVCQALEVVQAERKQFEEAMGVPASGRGASKRGPSGTGVKRSRSFEEFRQTKDPGPASGQS